VVAERILDSARGQLFARALVAIARADDQIGIEEGLRLRAAQGSSGQLRAG
jgi:hypothetical protein